MRLTISLIGVLFVCVSAWAEERGLRFTAKASLLPAMKGIAIVEAGSPGPDAPKHKAIAVVADYKATTKLAGEGPFDVWWMPKNGIAVRVTAGLKWKDGELKEIKVDDFIGVVNVRGGDQPRAALITIAPQDDPGPGEKGHIAIQTAKDYRVDMAVPAGFYSLWITPQNGARPRKVVDRFRVLAGKSVQLD